MALEEEEEEKSDILTTYKTDIKSTVLSIAGCFTHTFQIHIKQYTVIS